MIQIIDTETDFSLKPPMSKIVCHDSLSLKFGAFPAKMLRLSL